LKQNGKIVMTIVDNPYYEGAFKLMDAAKKAGYMVSGIFDFVPTDFAGYSHENTIGDESALSDHCKFATFVFELDAS